MQRNRTSLATLIANDIVHLGMDMTSSFNYIVDLDDYIKEFDKDSKDYIMNHKDEIIEEIHSNENIAQMDYNPKIKEIDMVFYFDGLMDRLEKMVYNTGQSLDKDLEIEEVRDIAEDIYNDEDFKDKIITSVAKSSLGREL